MAPITREQALKNTLASSRIEGMKSPNRPVPTAAA